MSRNDIIFALNKERFFWEEHANNNPDLPFRLYATKLHVRILDALRILRARKGGDSGPASSHPQ